MSRDSDMGACKEAVGRNEAGLLTEVGQGRVLKGKSLYLSIKVYLHLKVYLNLEVQVHMMPRNTECSFLQRTVCSEKLVTREHAMFWRLQI